MRTTIYTYQRRLLLTAIGFFSFAFISFATTYTVSTTSDAGAGSLRQAITDANDNAGADIIAFSIGTGAQSIPVTTALPTIMEAVTIDGTTQPGFSSVPLIAIGASFTGTVFTFNISTVNITLKSLDLSQTGAKAGIGVFVNVSHNCTIQNCYIKNRTEGIKTTICDNLTILNNDLTDSGSIGSSTYALSLISPTNLAVGAISGNTFGGSASNGVYIDAMSNRSVRLTGGNINLSSSIAACAGVALFIDNGSNITVDGLNLGYSGGGVAGIGVWFRATTTYTLSNCSIQSRGDGIILQNGSNATLTNNNLVNSGTLAGYCIKIVNLTGTLNASGFTFGGTTTDGIYLDAQSNRIISDGSVANTNITIADGSLLGSLSGNSIRLQNSSNCRIDNVDLENTGGSVVGIALSLSNLSGTTYINSNQLVKRQYAVACADCGATQVTCNNIKNNTHAVNFTGTTTGNPRLVNTNAIYGNTYSIVNGTSGFSTIDATGNWWNSLNGPGAEGTLVNSTAGSNITLETPGNFLYSTPGCVGGAPLPVELLSFSAKKQGNAVSLDWQTSSEINNLGFQIERSVRGKSFERIGFLKSEGGKNSTTQYQFTDEHPLSINYYRLRQIDRDGTESFSKIISMRGSDKLDVVVFPNPTEGLITIEFDNKNKASETILTVFNGLGQQVLQKTTHDNQSSVDLSNQPTGIYWLQMETDGEKIIKKINRQ